MEQIELSLETEGLEGFKEQLQEVIKPYQQEQNRRQKKIDFLAKCVRCIEKNDFFQLDELLRSKQVNEVLEDPDFESCSSIFDELRKLAGTQVDHQSVKLKGTLLQLAEEAGLPFEMDFPRFHVLKGIEGTIDLSTRSTTINQTTLKSIDPKRIIASALKLKRQFYDSPFDPQAFINALLECYKEILKKEGRGMGEAVPVQQLYTDFVWSLQNKTFFQNMDKGKFKGCSVEQFAINIWRFFQAKVSTTGGHRIKMNAGRIKSLWLIDHDGQQRQISHVLFH